MLTKISKEFRWEMSHRLPYHNGHCKNIHGHSYKLRVTIDGEPDSRGILLDFYDMEFIITPIINKLDHAFLVDSNDFAILEFLKRHNFKHEVLEGYTTAENISTWMLKEISQKLAVFPNLNTLLIRLYETEDAFAEVSMSLNEK